MDRDGTINEEVGYLRTLGDLHLFVETFEAVRRINGSGMKAVVITNQSGIAKGYFDEAFVNEVHAHINRLLGEKGAAIDRFYFCPHHPTDGNPPFLKECRCRKPRPGMLLQAAEELGIELAGSYMIGDMPKDIEAVLENAGIQGILVRTGYGKDVESGAKSV